MDEKNNDDGWWSIRLLWPVEAIDLSVRGAWVMQIATLVVVK